MDRPRPRAAYALPLPDVVLQALAEHVRRFPPGPHGVIFSRSDGHLLRRSACGSLWRRLNQEAGVTGRTFHSLRHYHASLFIRHGQSVKTVQTRLGHASGAETLDLGPLAGDHIVTQQNSRAGQDLGPSCYLPTDG